MAFDFTRWAILVGLYAAGVAAGWWLRGAYDDRARLRTELAKVRDAEANAPNAAGPTP